MLARRAGTTCESRLSIVFRSGGRFATMMPMQASFMLQMLRSMASHIGSSVWRKDVVMGILVMDMPVPLVQVSMGDMYFFGVEGGFDSMWIGLFGVVVAYMRVKRNTTRTPHCVCLLSLTWRR